jgi:transcriptional regulator with XRE-family HTH domain
MPADQIRKGTKPHLYVKEWMEHLGISDETLAGRIGVSRTTVWKRYSEQRRLDLGKIHQIADDLSPGISSKNG